MKLDFETSHIYNNHIGQLDYPWETKSIWLIAYTDDKPEIQVINMDRGDSCGAILYATPDFNSTDLVDQCKKLWVKICAVDSLNFMAISPKEIDILYKFWTNNKEAFDM